MFEADEQKHKNKQDRCSHPEAAYYYNDDEDICNFEPCNFIAEYNCIECGYCACDEHLNIIGLSLA